MKINMISKSAKYLMLTTMIGSIATGVVAPSVSQAAELDPAITQLLNDATKQDSAITYVTNGVERVLPVAKGAKVTMTTTASNINVTIGGRLNTLKNVTDITFKGITVSTLTVFDNDTVRNVTIDNSDFTKGILMVANKNLTGIVVKDSHFGSKDYSLSVNSNHNLKSFVIDNSVFEAHLRVYSNSSLDKTTVSNSTLKDYIQQYSNKRGYYTDLLNSRIERGNLLKIIESGGMTTNDIFYINRGAENIAATRFDASQPGQIIHKMSDGKPQITDIPAGVKVRLVENVINRITISLTNGQKITLNDAKSLTFRNVDVATAIAFTQAGLKLEAIEFINSRTQLIDIANSRTIKSVKVNRTDVTQSVGFLSVYNNSALKEFVVQDSAINGSAAYLSMYNNRAVETYVMNNVYVHGYVSTYNLGNAPIQISNSMFDDYFATNQTIEGEGGPKIIGDAPVLKETGKTLQVGNPFYLSEFVNATDTEDGILTNIYIVAGNVNPYSPGHYPITVSVTDSDDNTVEKDITIVVE